MRSGRDRLVSGGFRTGSKSVWMASDRVPARTGVVLFQQILKILGIHSKRIEVI